MPPPAQPYNPIIGGSPQQQNGMAIAALICGIIGAVLGLCCWPLGIIASIAALITGFLGLKQSDASGGSGRGMAIAGLVLGGIGILLAVLVLVFYGVTILGGSTST